MERTEKIYFNNLDSCNEFDFLKNMAPFDIRNTDVQRVKSCKVSEAAGLEFYYAFTPVDGLILDQFQRLSDQQQVLSKYREVLSGVRMNTGENRMVLHHLTRGRVLANVEVMADGTEKGEFYRSEKLRIKAFSDDVRSGKILNEEGEKYEHVVQIGIGGSDLGPRAVWHALKGIVPYEKQMDVRFISNVDPDDAAMVMSDLDVKKTLFILVSKSGTTQETLTNMELVLSVIKKAGVKNPDSQMIAVTSETSPLARNSRFASVFFMDDYIGGRYSSTSAVGGVVLSLAFGYDVFSDFLEGAHEEDMCCLNPSVNENGPLLDAMIGVFYRNVLNMPCTAILPYSQGLNRFPAHLQQLDMESNGKSVNRFGEKVSYCTGPVIFGEPGTNGQHSFYQLLHQGTDIIPLQFIGFRKNQGKLDKVINGSDSRKKLNANLTAQMVAFAQGKRDVSNLNKNFRGGRYSSLIVGDKLTARSLGALLSHYENKVMFQGFIWNLNSFDQEGVQLGKILASQVLSGAEGNAVLKAVSDIFS